MYIIKVVSSHGLACVHMLYQFYDPIALLAVEYTLETTAVLHNLAI